MTPEQKEKAQFWRYLTKGIRVEHRNNWRRQTLKEEGQEAADLFDRRVRYSNKD